MKLGCIGSCVRSKNKQSVDFTDWAYSEVLPSIRKHVAYIAKEKAIELFGLIDIDEAEARRRINKPREQTKLHYDVVSYIERHDLNVLIRLGLGENQITHFSIMYSKKRDT